MSNPHLTYNLSCSGFKSALPGSKHLNLIMQLLRFKYVYKGRINLSDMHFSPSSSAIGFAYRSVSLWLAVAWVMHDKGAARLGRGRVGCADVGVHAIGGGHGAGGEGGWGTGAGGRVTCTNKEKTRGHCVVD